MLLKSDSAVTQQSLRGAPGCLCRRGERKYQRQQRGEFRSGVHRFLTHSGNWRHSCWQQNSASWWNETSGGVGHQVEQRDAVSNGGQSRSVRWEAEHGQNWVGSGAEPCKDRGMDGTGVSEDKAVFVLTDTWSHVWNKWALETQMNRPLLDAELGLVVTWVWGSHKCASMGAAEHKHASAEAKQPLFYRNTFWNERFASRNQISRVRR